MILKKILGARGDHQRPLDTLVFLQIQCQRVRCMASCEVQPRSTLYIL